jgi:hypothetical protein
MDAFVVRAGPDSCPVGCGEDIILVRCRPGGRLAGWCKSCEVSLPIPLPDDYCLTDDNVAPARYAPDGLELPEWAAVTAAGVASQVVRRVSADEWVEYLAWAHKARRTGYCS